MRSKMRKLLERTNSLLFDKWKTEVPKLENSEIVSAKNGSSSLTYKIDEKNCQVISLYNPEAEAEILLDAAADIKENGYLVVVGAGLGYQLEAIHKKYPLLKFLIYEPVEELLYRFFDSSDFSIDLVNLIEGVDIDGERLLKIARGLSENFVNPVSIFFMPFYEINFPEEFKAFTENYRTRFLEAKADFITAMRFQERQVFSNIKNMGRIAKSPSVGYRTTKPFEGKPAIIIAAGPSLNEELPLLKKIYDEKSAYLIVAGSSIRPVLAEGIIPHAACIIDSASHAGVVTEPIIERNLKEVSLFFGDIGSPEAIEGYPGSLIQVPLVSGEITPIFLRMKPATPLMEIAQTITVMAVHSAFMMNMSPIILVGQNLGALEGKTYATGTQYDSDQKYSDKVTIYLPSNDGGKIASVVSYRDMRDQMAREAKTLLEYQKKKGFPISTLYNSTRGGAKIEGFPYCPLSELEKTLPKGCAEEPLILKDEKVIDKKFSLGAIENWRKGKMEAIKLLQKYKTILDKANDSKNMFTLTEEYVKLRTLFIDIKEHTCLMNAGILPTYTNYNITIEKISYINEMTDFKKKKDMVYRTFGAYLNLLTATFLEFVPLFDEATDELEEFLKSEGEDV